MREINKGVIPSATGSVRGLQRKPYKNRHDGTKHWWSDTSKVEAVKTYLIAGSLADVSRVCGIPYQTIRKWHTSDWWKEIENNLRSEDSVELSARLRTRINKALEITEDRLENGDFQYDPRTGSMIRRPVSLKDANKAMVDMVKVKTEVDAAPVRTQNQQAVIDTLAKLTEEFTRMARGARQPRIIDVIPERIEDGSQSVTQEPTAQLP